MALKTPKREGLQLSLKSTQHAFFLPYQVTVCSTNIFLFRVLFYILKSMVFQ